jgi:cytochrome c biogenesis protein CcdA
MLEEYKITDQNGNIVSGKINNSITDIEEYKKVYFFDSTLLLIIISGFLDSINPCAITVMLFLIAIIYTRVSLSRDNDEDKRRTMLKLGLSYVFAIYITYMAIGISLRQILDLIKLPNFLSSIGVVIMLFVGIVKLKDVFYPHLGFSLKMSDSKLNNIRKIARKTSIPATIIAGILVAFYEFPCTGGIYVAILNFISVKTTFLNGLTYLFIYNLAFVSPLIIIVFISTRREIVNFSLSKWQSRENKYIGILESIIYITLGIIFYLLNWYNLL